MKKIPLLLLDAYRKPGCSTCFLVRVACKDGEVFGFTSLDSSYRFDDGEGAITYSAENELRPQNLQEEASFETDNTDLVGWFDEVMERRVLSGRLDFAEIAIYRVNYLKPGLGYELVAFGTVGEVDFAANAQSKRKVEFLSLKQQLNQTPNEMYSLTCRADYGDDRCGMPFVWSAGTISAVGVSPYLNITISGVAQPVGFYELGVVEFLDGDNAGATLEVESWAADGTIQFSYLAPFPNVIGVSVRIRQDCGKTETDCKAKGNIVRMRAEHLTPAEDRALMVPGAYVKSSGAL